MKVIDLRPPPACPEAAAPNDHYFQKVSLFVRKCNKITQVILPNFLSTVKHPKQRISTYPLHVWTCMRSFSRSNFKCKLNWRAPGFLYSFTVHVGLHHSCIKYSSLQNTLFTCTCMSKPLCFLVWWICILMAKPSSSRSEHAIMQYFVFNKYLNPACFQEK